MTIEFQHDISIDLEYGTHIPPEIMEELKPLLDKIFCGEDLTGAEGLVSNQENELWILIIAKSFLYQIIIGEKGIISKGLDLRLFQKIDTIKFKRINEIIYQLVFRDYTISLSCSYEDIDIPEFIELLENRCKNIIDNIIKKSL